MINLLLFLLLWLYFKCSLDEPIYYPFKSSQELALSAFNMRDLIRDINALSVACNSYLWLDTSVDCNVSELNNTSDLLQIKEWYSLVLFTGPDCKYWMYIQPSNKKKIKSHRLVYVSFKTRRIWGFLDLSSNSCRRLCVVDTNWNEIHT